MEDNNILIEEKISKLFVKFAIPAIISMVLAGMQTIVDGIFVGNFIGPNAMASVNIASPFMQLIIGISMISSIGCQSYMGLKLGDNKIEEVQNTFKTTTIVVAITAIFVTIVGFVFSEQIAGILGANDVLMEMVSTYIKTLALFTLPMTLMFLFGFSLRILGKPELYFKGMILSLIMNISLNYILIAKLGLGIKGAAIATGCSYASAFLVVVWPILDRKNIINLFVGKFDKSTIYPVMYNGSSEGINSISTAVGAFLFNTAFMQIAGEGGVAAFTAINYVAQFGILLMFGISDGIGPIVSYNYGAKAYDRVDEILKISFKVIIAVGSMVFITLFFFGENLITMFVKDNPQILDLAMTGAGIYAFAFFMNGFNIVNSGYFTSIGNAKASVIVASSRGLVFIFIGIFILPMIFGVNGIWMSIPFAELCTFFIGFKLMKKSNKLVTA